MALDLRELLDPRHTAVLTMELQRGVVGDLASMPHLRDAVAAEDILPHTASLLSAARGVGARVVALGSAEGARVPQMDVYAYGASKAGLHHLVAHLARKLARKGITVNAISPGAFPTDMLRPALERWGRKRSRKMCPCGVSGSPPTSRRPFSTWYRAEAPM